MNKFLLSFCLLIAGLSLNAQVTPCTPNTSFTQAGFYPDTLPHACVGFNYQEVIDFVFPADTMVFSQTVDFDSFVVLKIDSVPDGLNYQFDQSSQVYIPQNGNPANGCVTIFGTPTTANTPQDSVYVQVEGYVTVFGSVQNSSLTIAYPVKVDAQCSNSIFDRSAHNFNMSIAPNPVAQSANVTFYLENAAQVSFELFDISGKLIDRVNASNFPAGDHSINLISSAVELNNGIYFVKANVDGAIIASQKLIINK